MTALPPRRPTCYINRQSRWAKMELATAVICHTVHTCDLLYSEENEILFVHNRIQVQNPSTTGPDPVERTECPNRKRR